MNIRIVRNVATALAVLSWIVAGNCASAQLLRPRARYSDPVVQPVQPASADQAAPQPGSVEPGQPAQSQDSVAAGGAAVQGRNIGNGFLPPLDPARIVRGSQLVGQTILDPRRQKLGVIKDFLVDSQTARVMYVVMAQEGTGPKAEWIVVPFDLLRLSANGQGSQPIFILNLQVAQLRTAPHMRSNAWETIRDPQFISQVQQFYRPTEWTARRFSRDMNSDGQGTRPQPGQLPGGRQGQGIGRPAGEQPMPGAQPSGSEGNQSPAPAPGSLHPGTDASGECSEARPPQPNEPQTPHRPSAESEKGNSAARTSNGGTAPEESRANRQ